MRDAASQIMNSLTSTSYLIINKSLMRFLNGDATAVIILHELIDKYKYYSNLDQLDNEGYFYYTLNSLQKNFGIKRSAQDHALRLLIEKDLIRIENKGFPIKRHFKLHFDNIIAALDIVQKDVKVAAKEEYFTEINKPHTYDSFMEAKGNMHDNLANSIWALKMRSNNQITLTSKAFGKLKSYLVNRFRGKLWDYNVFLQVKLKSPMTIESVIDSLKSTEESSRSSVILSFDKIRRHYE